MELLLQLVEQHLYLESQVVKILFRQELLDRAILNMGNKSKNQLEVLFLVKHPNLEGQVDFLGHQLA